MTAGVVIALLALLRGRRAEPADTRRRNGRRRRRRRTGVSVPAVSVRTVRATCRRYQRRSVSVGCEASLSHCEQISCSGARPQNSTPSRGRRTAVGDMTAALRRRPAGAAAPTQPVACAVGDAGRLLHDPGRRDDRRGRQPVASWRSCDADYDAVIWVTSAYLLGLRGAAAGGRPPRRPVRARRTSTCSAWRCSPPHRCGAGWPAPSDADRRPRGAGRRRGAAHPADAVDDHPDLPRRAARRRDERVGCHRRRRHAGRPAGRRRPGRRARLAVDLLRQRADRRHRPGAGLLAGSRPAHREARLRPARCGCCRASACS